MKILIFIGQLSLLSLQLRELCKENASVKGHIAALEETVNVHEMEAKASRETIMRLVSEVNREQKKAASCTEGKGKLQQVRRVGCVCTSVIMFMKRRWETRRRCAHLLCRPQAALSRRAGAAWGSVTRRGHWYGARKSEEKEI